MTDMVGLIKGEDHHGRWASWEPWAWRYRFYYDKGEVHDTYDHEWGSTLVNDKRSQHTVHLRIQPHPGVQYYARQEYIQRLMWQAANETLLEPGQRVLYINGDSWDKRAVNLRVQTLRRKPKQLELFECNRNGAVLRAWNE